jgi:hypothetical protein
MKCIKLFLDPYENYSFFNTSSVEMELLGLFLSTEVGCGESSWEEWILEDNQGMETLRILIL